VSFGVVELEVLCCRSITGLHQLGARVPAEPVGNMHDQLAEMKGGGEL